MTRGTTATSSVPAEDTSTTVAPRWMNVVFLQGEEADAVLDMIERVGPEDGDQSLVAVGLRRRDERCRPCQRIRV